MIQYLNIEIYIYIIFVCVLTNVLICSDTANIFQRLLPFLVHSADRVENHWGCNMCCNTELWYPPFCVIFLYEKFGLTFQLGGRVLGGVEPNGVIVLLGDYCLDRPRLTARAYGCRGRAPGFCLVSTASYPGL